MPSPITRNELERLVADNAVTIIDALPDDYWRRQHLPGALNLTEADVDAQAASLLPDKDATIVTYCSDTTCGNSRAVASRLEDLGYTNVRKYADGIKDWLEAGNSVESSGAGVS